MEFTVIIKAVTVACAFFAGWFLGRTTPHWAEDRHREYNPHTAMEQYYHAPTDYTGQYGGCFGGAAADVAGARTGLKTGIWLPALLIIAAFALAFFFWYDGPKEHRTDRINFIVDPSHWIVIGTAALGYVAAIIANNIGRR
ncbi:hypothetical protein JW859_04605 [bacterium]|nr:hypothetical protein [bacterium]